VELASYQGRTPTEIADVARVGELLRSGDPFSRGLSLHITGSALIVHPPTNRVLLRWHARQQAWLHVGGHVDPGETDPLTTAVREGAEETGLTDLRPWPGPGITHVVVVPVPASSKEPAHEHADIRYLLATDTPDAVRPEDPAAELRWLTVHDAVTLTSEENLRETLRRIEFGEGLSASRW
jgi:8-oxo-dGTP pyrophosphatase MutT (NUDIX family)